MRRPYSFAAGCLLLGALSAPASVRAVDDWLPDVIVRQSDLFDNDIRTNIVPGRRHLRMSNGTPNIGLGKLHLFGVLPGNPDGTQNVMQRIYRSDGTSYDREAGLFVYHPQHGHIHIEDWCIYRLRQGKNATGLLNATTVISLVLIVAYVVAVWAMTGKPD